MTYLLGLDSNFSTVFSPKIIADRKKKKPNMEDCTWKKSTETSRAF